MPSEPSAACPNPPPVVGLILAGGLGRRMRGPGEAQAATPKPLVMLGGRPLIAHVIARLEPQVRRLAINANGPLGPYAAFGLPLLADPLPDHPGPLAGVLAGLEHLAASDPAALLVSVPADTPFLPGDLVARLLACHNRTGGVVCAASAGQVHPVVALWPGHVRAALRAALEAGERRVTRLVQQLDTATEYWPAAEADPFFNVNTPEDLEQAQERLHARE